MLVYDHEAFKDVFDLQQLYPSPLNDAGMLSAALIVSGLYRVRVHLCLCLSSQFLVASHSLSCQSIRNHDQGKKHVEIVAEFFRKKREDKLKGAQSESDLARQMERIEKV